MSMLPAGHRLENFLPDLDDLLQDPKSYLQEGPIVIGPRRMYGLAVLFGLPGLALLIWAALGGKFDGEKVAMGVGLLLGGAIWLGWSILMRGHQIVLRVERIEVV